MNKVTRYDLNEDVVTGELFVSPVPENIEGPYVTYEDYAALQQKLDAMASENADLKISRSILAENTLETCSVLASVGSRHEAIMRGFMASTGNGNKYPKQITTLVNEALREIETPATDAYLNSVRAEAVSYVADHIDSLQRNMLVSSNSLRDYAVMFRSGTHDTADKAG